MTQRMYESGPPPLELPPHNEENGHWEEHNPEKPYRTPYRRLGQIAHGLTVKYPDGWRFIPDESSGREKYGHIIYFVPDEQKAEQ